MKVCVCVRERERERERDHMPLHGPVYGGVEVEGLVTYCTFSGAALVQEIS